MDLILAAALFFVGLVFGSFLNVCISRIPRDLSIVAPRSFCPHCQAPIGWRDNLPVLSWIFLKGRCRHCRQRISWRYPAVELLTAALFAVSYASFGFTWMTVKACVFCFLLVGLIFMDAETGLLPAEFTYAGIALGLLLAWVAPVDASGTVFLTSAFEWHGLATGRGLSSLDSALAAIVGAGFFHLAWAGYYLVRKRDGLGFGDIAMAAMAGAFLGLKLTVLVILLSPILATLYAFGSLFLRPSAAPIPHASESPVQSPANSFLWREVPFGVFLGLSALVTLFVGQPIWIWYLGLFH